MSARGAPRANEIVSPAITTEPSNAPRPAAARTAPILAAVKRRGRGLRGTALAGNLVLGIAFALASWRAFSGGNDAAVASASAGSAPVAQAFLLRLHDLPLGYRSS